MDGFLEFPDLEDGMIFCMLMLFQCSTTSIGTTSMYSQKNHTNYKLTIPYLCVISELVYLMEKDRKIEFCMHLFTESPMCARIAHQHQPPAHNHVASRFHRAVFCLRLTSHDLPVTQHTYIKGRHVMMVSTYFCFNWKLGLVNNLIRL